MEIPKPLAGHTLRKKANVTTARHLLSIAIAAFTAFAPTASIHAEEQFSLNATPDLLFDGSNTQSGPITGEHNGIAYEIVQGYAVAQGDMVLGRLFANGELEIPISTRGLAAGSLLERWPDGIVPFQFSSEISQSLRTRALEAVAHWNDKTSIFLVERTTANAALYPNYVSFEASNGCASWVGRIGGEQAFLIANDCAVGSIIHEIGHAIGVFHELTRADRDNYVTVHWQNVITDKDVNFQKLDADADLVGDYDYGSIMHYGERFFSRNGEATISAPDNVSIGQREALSPNDIATVNAMYATDLALNLSTRASENEAHIEIDINVSNLGSLGANRIALTARIGDDSDWLSISSDSGWLCQKFAEELRCSRDTLIENSTSSFTVVAAPNSTSIGELSVRVESRTLDTDLNNNVHNDEITLQPSAEDSNTDPSTTVETDQQQNTQGDSDPEPDVQAANPEPNNSPNIDTGGSGGSAATSWWVLAFLMIAWLRRRSS